MTLHNSYDHYVLAGDIGGTKTNVGIFARGRHRPLLKFFESYPSTHFHNLESIIALFLSKFPISPRFACFGMPGPVHNGVCRLTNLTWETRESSLKKRFRFTQAKLINDLTATSFAIPLLAKNELHALNRGSGQKDGNLAILAPGTGFGQGLVIHEQGVYIPVPSEGGHVDFGPNNEQEIELLRYLKKKYGHVSLERIVTGQGLAEIYAFFTGRRKDKEDRRILAEMKNADPAMVISRAAINEEAASCKAALHMFVSIFGAAAGNLALVGMTKGGVYLGGGIPPKILPKLKDGTFFSSFTDKGRFKGLLENIPIHVILNDKAALMGAASRAFKIADTI